MMSKRKLQPDCNLYLVLDTQVAGYQRLLEIARQAVSAGVDIIQLRDKTGSKEDILYFSRKIQQILPEHIPYIINDHPDIARTVGAGLHIGQDDISLMDARRQLGPDALIGVSCQRWEHVWAAQEGGADYVGFGSVYKTKTKPERELMDFHLLSKVLQYSPLPVFAIGGIDLRNVKPVIHLGANRIAVTRAIMEAENIGETVGEFKDMLRLQELVGFKR